MLKLHIYGYLNRVRSSRRLEAEAHRNIEVIWLLRGLKPDFRTIAAFRRVNGSAFRTVFREFVVLCRQLDLFGRELLAVDGARIKAVNNKDRNFTRGALTKFMREADEKLSDYMKRLDDGDAEEERVGGRSGGPGRGDTSSPRRSRRSGVSAIGTTFSAARCWSRVWSSVETRAYPMSKAISVPVEEVEILPRAIRRENPYSATKKISGAKSRRNSGFLQISQPLPRLGIYESNL